MGDAILRSPSASLLRRVGPSWTAVLASVLLSLIVIAGEIGPIRDGMLYVQAAQRMLEGDWQAGFAYFDRLFYPLLIAWLAQLTGLGTEAAAYLFSVVLMAASCSLLVAGTARPVPGGAWLACLVVLSLPAFNGYRDFIIREFGAWCSTLLASWGGMGWLWFAYLVVLMAFMLKTQFLITRYVRFLRILAVPLVTAMLARWPRWRAGVSGLAVVLALSNVVSLAEQRTQFRDAGQWLAAHVVAPGLVYLKDARMAYFADWSFLRGRHEETGRRSLAGRIEAVSYDFLALSRQVTTEERAWLSQPGFVAVAQFQNRAGDRVTIFRRESRPSADGTAEQETRQ